MKVDVDDDNLPEFFKVYISHYSSKQMLIPSDFVNYMGGRKSGSSQLIGSSGQTWRVELVDDGNDLYFVDGWRDFVENNMIREGEFIFFKFNGNLIFSVIIYDKSMCEKGAAFIVKKCSQVMRNGKADAGEELNGARPVKREDVGPSQPEGHLFSSKDKMAERPALSVKPFFEKCITISNVKLFKFNLPISFVHEHLLSYKNNEKMVLRTSGNSSWKMKIINSHRKIVLTIGWRAFARDNNLRVGDVCKFELLNRLEMMVHVVKRQEGIGQTNIHVSASENRSLKRTVGVSQHGKSKYGLPFVEEGQNAAARTMPSSVKPSFVLDIKKHNVDKCLLKIPPLFVQENTLCYRANEKMILRTKEDSSWTVNIIRSETKTSCYYYFSSGWATFVHDNNIKEGDKCEFEILNRLEMKVHLTLSSKR